MDDAALWSFDSALHSTSDEISVKGGTFVFHGIPLRQCFAQDKFTHLKLSTVRLWIQFRPSHLASSKYSCSNSVSCLYPSREQATLSKSGYRPAWLQTSLYFRRASWNTQFDSDYSLACLVDKPCGRFVAWLFSSLRDGVVRLPRTIVTWSRGSSVSAAARSVSTLPRLVETAVRCKVLALLSDQPNSSGYPFDLLCWPAEARSARNMDYAVVNSWNVYVGKRSEDS